MTCIGISYHHSISFQTGPFPDTWSTSVFQVMRTIGSSGTSLTVDAAAFPGIRASNETSSPKEPDPYVPHSLYNVSFRRMELPVY